MNFGIVTVYDSINSGSFWQAYILGQYLERLGHSVYYLKRKVKRGSSVTKISQIRMILKFLLRDGMTAGIKTYRMICEFRKSKRVFEEINEKQIELKKIDCFVLGSDTIWNINSQHFRENYKYYWGAFNLKPIIVYAPSIADTQCDLITSLIPDVRMVISSWSAIGVRDKMTYNMVSTLSDRKVSYVCDPIFLFERKDYSKYIRNSLENYRYIFIYAFAELPPDFVAAIKRFADSKNLEIVYGVHYIETQYADKVLVNSPYEFLDYMYNATYVITDTYHGCAFSINFERQFIAIEQKKSKVKDLIERLGFKDRLCNHNLSITEIIEALERKIDYSNRNQIVKDYRESSQSFLKESIEGIVNLV